MNIDKLINYLDNLLNVSNYKDYAPNGLQVSGIAEINKIVTGVSASQALIEQAIAVDADAILVHHGYFWKNESPVITGIKQRRIKALLANNINLIAYHLPLDGHAEFGNNAQLARLWGIQDTTEQQNSLLRIGQLTQDTNFADFKKLVDKTLNRKSLHLPGGKNMVKTIAWCSGGAQGYIEQAVNLGADVYISGEVSEPTTHIALESKIHYLSAGHHATECLGVKSLGNHLQEQFSLDVTFINILNPV
jgi:dinuclear metal center YbgI/SA1388 family protein